MPYQTDVCYSFMNHLFTPDRTCSVKVGRRLRGGVLDYFCQLAHSHSRFGCKVRSKEGGSLCARRVNDVPSSFSRESKAICREYGRDMCVRGEYCLCVRVCMCVSYRMFLEDKAESVG